MVEMRAAPLPPPSQYRPVPQRRAKSIPKRAGTKADIKSVAAPSSTRQEQSCQVDWDNFCETGWTEADHASPGFCDVDNDETCDNEDSEASGEPEFLCNVCSSTFTWKEDLRSQMILIHSEKCWRCSKYSEVMMSPSEFSERFKTHAAPAASESVISSEIKNKISPEKPSGSELFQLNCFHCDQKFVNHSELSDHVKVHHPSSFCPCENCDLLKYSGKCLHFHRGMCAQRDI